MSPGLLRSTLQCHTANLIFSRCEQVACLVVKLLLYGLFLAAFTFLLLETLKLYSNTLGRTLYHCSLLKTMAVGWGKMGTEPNLHCFSTGVKDQSKNA